MYEHNSILKHVYVAINHDIELLSLTKIEKNGYFKDYDLNNTITLYYIYHTIIYNLTL